MNINVKTIVIEKDDDDSKFTYTDILMNIDKVLTLYKAVGSANKALPVDIYFVDSNNNVGVVESFMSINDDNENEHRLYVSILNASSVKIILIASE